MTKKDKLALLSYGAGFMVSAGVLYVLFTRTSEPKMIAPPAPPPVRKPELVQGAYIWVDRRGFLTAGQLKDVPPECFHGIDTVKGWSHGLIKKPKVGDFW